MNAHSTVCHSFHPSVGMIQLENLLTALDECYSMDLMLLETTLHPYLSTVYHR